MLDNESKCFAFRSVRVHFLSQCYVLQRVKCNTIRSLLYMSFFRAPFKLLKVTSLNLLHTLHKNLIKFRFITAFSKCTPNNFLVYLLHTIKELITNTCNNVLYENNCFNYIWNVKMLSM